MNATPPASDGEEVYWRKVESQMRRLRAIHHARLAELREQAPPFAAAVLSKLRRAFQSAR